MTTCRDLEVLVSLHAAGALDASESARVEAHLAGCAACRAVAGDLADALSLAKLPPVSDAERRAFQDLGDRTLAALRRSMRVRSIGKRIAAGLAAAAAAAAVVLAPAVVQRDGAAPPPEEAAWQQPDLDAIWSDASVLDFESSSSTVSGASASTDADDAYADAVLALVD